MVGLMLIEIYFGRIRGFLYTCFTDNVNATHDDTNDTDVEPGVQKCLQSVYPLCLCMQQ